MCKQCIQQWLPDNTGTVGIKCNNATWLYYHMLHSVLTVTMPHDFSTISYIPTMPVGDTSAAWPYNQADMIDTSMLHKQTFFEFDKQRKEERKKINVSYCKYILYSDFYIFSGSENSRITFFEIFGFYSTKPSVQESEGLYKSIHPKNTPNYWMMIKKNSCVI